MEVSSFQGVLIRGGAHTVHTLANECTKFQNPRRHHVSGLFMALNTIMCMHAFPRKMADRTNGFQGRECWISATERFQRKPHKFFNLRCPLSMLQLYSQSSPMQFSLHYTPTTHELHSHTQRHHTMHILICLLYLCLPIVLHSSHVFQT